MSGITCSCVGESAGRIKMDGEHAVILKVVPGKIGIIRRVKTILARSWR